MGDLKDAVVLVNEQDEMVGTMDKLEAHRQGRLHRAFSVFLFVAHGRLLMQQRAPDKYHSAGLWTNTCCSHPRNGEPTAAAARRRLMEEMGIALSPDFAFTFIYRAEVGDGLIEHELDHVFIHRYSGEVDHDPAEVSTHAWVDPEELTQDLNERPHRYTAWLHVCWPRVREHFQRTLRT